jgi:hypothetical protein
MLHYLSSTSQLAHTGKDVDAEHRKSVDDNVEDSLDVLKLPAWRKRHP